MTLKEATRRWASRRRQYVVGYIASGNCLYHHQRWDKQKQVSLPMTLKQARTTLKRMSSPGAAIFRLTPIQTGGGSR